MNSSKAALEKQKLAYIFNRDSSMHLSVSSPLEAPSANTILFSLAALDTGTANPQV